MAHEPSVEVACYTVVAERVGAVGCDVDVDHPVAFEMIVFSGRLSHRSVVGENDDSRVVGTDTYLVLSANHAEGVDTAQT